MKKILVFSLLAFLNHSNAQNLVSNPGFDEFEETRWSTSTLEYCTGWTNPTLASPDYFNSALSHNPHLVDPKTWWGYQTPLSGTACTGIIAYWPEDNKPYSEYLEARLIQPLVEGEIYEVSMNVSLAECSTLSLTSLGIYLSDKEIFMKTVAMLKYKPQLVFDIRTADTSSWTKLSLTYTARGGEQYMIIGQFSYDQYIKIKKEMPSPSITEARMQAYYFIEDVSVTPLKQGVHVLEQLDTASPVGSVTSTAQLTFDTQKPFVLEHILFETGSDVLTLASYPELDEFVAWLNQNPQLRVEVNGYTDADGSEIQNLRLSQRRAQAVCRYLEEKGIDIGRLKPQGFGASNPRDSNTTEKGKTRNRRVEIKTF